MKKLAGQLSYFFKGNPPAVLGTIIIGAFIFFSVFAPVFAPYGPTERGPAQIQIHRSNAGRTQGKANS